MVSLEASADQRDQNWQILIGIFQFFEGLISIWQKCESTRAFLWVYLVLSKI